MKINTHHTGVVIEPGHTISTYNIMKINIHHTGVVIEPGHTISSICTPSLSNKVII